MPSLSVSLEPPKNKQSTTVLTLIAVFKLFKGILLLGVSAGALRYVHRDLAEVVMHWVDVLRVDPDSHFMQALLSRVLSVSPGELRMLSVGTFIYAALFLTEGTGLLLHKKWAEYFTTVTTGIFIPLEVYEIVRHVTPAKVVVLFINVGIVVYLIRRLRGERPMHSGR